MLRLVEMLDSDSLSQRYSVYRVDRARVNIPAQGHDTIKLRKFNSAKKVPFNFVDLVYVSTSKLLRQDEIKE